MLKQLERDAIQADIAAVEALLKARTTENDPVGHMQFSRRLEDLTQRLHEVEASPSTSAEVGLFFGGRPVVGSYGILADFGGKAVAEFQALVSSAFAAQEGALGARGRLPQRDRSQLLLTDVARGSFGFILHQAQDPALIDSEMKEVVSHAVDLVLRVSSPDEETFETLAEGVDGRVFGSLQSFFKVLDDAGATMRIVGDQRDFTLQRAEVALARGRTESIAFDETEGEITGTIYILPVSRRFELHPVAGGEALRGAISPDCLNDLTSGGTEVRPGLIGAVHTARIRIRDIRAPGREPRKGYTLLSIVDSPPPAAIAGPALVSGN